MRGSRPVSKSAMPVDDALVNRETNERESDRRVLGLYRMAKALFSNRAPDTALRKHVVHWASSRWSHGRQGRSNRLEVVTLAPLPHS